MSDHKILNEDALLSSFDHAFEELMEHLDYEDHPDRQKVLEEVREDEYVLEEEFIEVPSTPQPIEQPQVQRVGSVDVMANTLSNYLTRTRTTKADEEVYKTTEEKRFFTIEQKIERLSRTILENTVVSGIGQGGDGQGPGSGEVRVLNMDDVDARDIGEGQTLVWNTNLGTFVPASIPGISSGVNTITAGLGIDVDPANGVGDVKISLDASIDDLVDVDLGGITDGQTLSWNSTTNQFEPVDSEDGVNTITAGVGIDVDPATGDGDVTISLDASIDDLDDVSLDGIDDGDTLIWDENAGTFVPGNIVFSGVTQIIAGDGIDVTPGTGVGEVTVTLDAALTDLRDVDGTPGTGDLLVYNGSEWQVGSLNTSQLSLNNPQGTPFSNLPDYSRYSVVADGIYTTQEDANILFVDLINDLDARIELLEISGDPYDPTDPYEGAVVDKLGELEDVNIINPKDDDLLVYDEPSGMWNSKTVLIPTSSVGILFPATGNEKEGDIFYDTNEEELYIYTDTWNKVSALGGASVAISSTPPADPLLGDLWVETDQWSLYVYDGHNWIGLTNDGLTGGGGYATSISNLKSDMYTAINESTDYDSLKSALLNVLS